MRYTDQFRFTIFSVERRRLHKYLRTGRMSKDLSIYPSWELGLLDKDAKNAVLIVK